MKRIGNASARIFLGGFLGLFATTVLAQTTPIKPATIIQDGAIIPPGGTSDDTAALQAAINAAAGTGSMVLLRAGTTYKLATVTNGCAITIGNSSVAIHGVPLSTQIDLVTTTPGASAFCIPGTESAEISALDIEGLVFTQQNVDPTSSAISGTWFGDSQLRDIRVYGNNTAGIGFNFSNYSDVTLDHVWAEDMLTACFAIAGSSAQIAADFHLTGYSRCDYGLNGLLVGDYVGGVYSNGTSWYQQFGAGILQTTTDTGSGNNSVHLVDNDFDSIGQNIPAWAPSTSYALGNFLEDSNGNIQRVSTAGTGGASAPSWSTTPGGTTADGSAVLTMVEAASRCLDFYYITDIMISAANRFGYCNNGSILIQGGALVNISAGNVVHSGGTTAIQLGAVSGSTPTLIGGLVAAMNIDYGHYGVTEGEGSGDFNLCCSLFTNQTSFGLNLSSIVCTSSLPANSASADLFDSRHSNGPIGWGNNNDEPNGCWRVGPNSGFSTATNATGVLDHNEALYTVTAPATIAPTAAVSCFGTGIGSQTVPPSQLVPGSKLRLRCSGIFSTGASNTATVTAAIDWGGSPVVTDTSATLQSSASNVPLWIEEECTFYTTSNGATQGTMQCTGGLYYVTSAGSLAVVPLNTTSAQSVTTSAAEKFDATLAFSASGPSATITTGDIRTIN